METNQSNLDRKALPPGTRLGQYEVRDLADATSTELIYEGFDLESGRPLLVHEFFPARIAHRLPDLSVRELNQNLEENFARNKLLFLDTGGNLARVKYSALAEILATWEENNTVYRACPIYRSITLEEYLDKNPAPTPMQVKGFLGPLLGAIETIHQENLLHLAISSTTLHIVQESNMPLLFGMGEVRYESNDITQKQTTMLEQAYTPIELSGGLENHIGPCTDIYGLAAVFYRLIARQTPVPAQARLVKDNLERLIDIKPAGYDDFFLSAIDRALSLKPEARPQSIAQFRTELLSPRKNNASLLQSQAQGAAQAAAKPSGQVLAPNLAPNLEPTLAPKPIPKADGISLIQAAQERAANAAKTQEPVRETNQDLKALLARKPKENTSLEAKVSAPTASPLPPTPAPAVAALVAPLAAPTNVDKPAPVLAKQVEDQRPRIKVSLSDAESPGVRPDYSNLDTSDEQTKRPFLRGLIGLGMLASVGGAAYYLINKRPKEVPLPSDAKVLSQAPKPPEIKTLATPAANETMASAPSAAQAVQAPTASPEAAPAAQSEVARTNAATQSTKLPEPVASKSPTSAPEPLPAPVPAPAPVSSAPVASPPLAAAPEATAKAAAPPPMQTAAVTDDADAPKPMRRAKPGRVNLRISPWGEVYVNGNFRGNSPPIKSIQLPPGRFTIEVRNPGASTQRTKVTVKSGKQSTITMKFPKLK